MVTLTLLLLAWPRHRCRRGHAIAEPLAGPQSDRIGCARPLLRQLWQRVERQLARLLKRERQGTGKLELGEPEYKR